MSGEHDLYSSISALPPVAFHLVGELPFSGYKVCTVALTHPKKLDVPPLSFLSKLSQTMTGWGSYINQQVPLYAAVSRTRETV